jgi:Anti-sigma factor NepR
VNQERQNGGAAKNGGLPPVPSQKKQRPAHTTESEGAIGAGLRTLYQDVIKEPLPDDIMALLDKLGSTDSDDE